jgi:spermidine synthase
MTPWVKLDVATMPGGGGELRLMQRGAEFSIMAGANELMNSRLSGSEEALATLAWSHIRDRPGPRILIGGLGMGFTLRATEAAVSAETGIVVAELAPAVIGWARGPLAGLFAGSLDDPRLDIREADVASIIHEADGEYDAILLDVDNGPEGLTRAANDRLYDAAGLRAARRALRAGGVLAVWSSGPDKGFTQRLRATGFAIEELRVAARSNGRGARHVIWIAVKPGGAKPRQ